MFIGPSSYTLEKINLVNDPTNIQPCVLQDFCVTDKADGIRKLCYIANDGKIYFITMTMLVQYSGSKCTNKVFFNSILDGEHIVKDKTGKTMNVFAIFDLYYLGNEDKRKLPFIDKGNCRYNLLRTMITEIRFIDESEIEKCTFMYKQFYPITKTESLFDCCKALFERMHLFEYETDGIILTSTKLGVGMEKEGDEVKNYLYSWKHSFKWKPPEFNTIDFVVKSKKLGSQDVKEYIERGTDLVEYKVLQLYVGYNPQRHGQINAQNTLFHGKKSISDDTSYTPVLFTPTNPSDSMAHTCYIEMKNDSSGEMKMFTEENTVMESETVVEFKYVMSEDKRFSWVPLRNRYEKTEDFKKGKSFGNAYHVANSNWQTIHNPITKEMLMDKPLSMDDIVNETVYYNKDGKTSRTKNLRDFHNIDIKRMLLDCVSGEGKTLIDFACGKGGDIPKWNNHFKFVLGIDISKDNIHNPMDGICARYLNLKKDKRELFDGLFIQGDSSKLYLTDEFADPEEGISKFVLSQVMGVGSPDTSRGEYIARMFNVAPKFDVGSIQFAIHYMFSDNESINNLMDTIDKYLKPDGYLLCTVFDPSLVMNLLGDKNTFTSYYTDDNGQRKKFFEIVKKFDGNLKDEPGLMIDVHMAWVSQEGKYIPEYFVTPKLLISSIKKAGCHLVDTDTFANVFNINSEWINNVIDHEENPKNKKFYKKVGEFYGELKGADKESKIWNDLWRYYIFKKL